MTFYKCWFTYLFILFVCIENFRILSGLSQIPLFGQASLLVLNFRWSHNSLTHSLKNCSPHVISMREKSPNMEFFSGPYYPVFRLNTEIYSVNLLIQYEYGKIQTRKNSYNSYKFLHRFKNLPPIKLEYRNIALKQAICVKIICLHYGI